MVALSLLCWSIYLCFRYFDRFRTLSCNFHPASSNFPPSIPLIFLNFPPSINPLLHALKSELFLPPRVCSSATHLFVHFQKYLRTPKQYSSIQHRILAWTNSSRRARRHVWCWVEFHSHHCLRGAIVLRRTASPNVVSIRVSSYWFVSHRCTFVSICCTFALGFTACLLRLSTLQYDAKRSHCRIGSHMFVLVRVSSY